MRALAAVTLGVLACAGRGRAPAAPSTSQAPTGVVNTDSVAPSEGAASMPQVPSTSPCAPSGDGRVCFPAGLGSFGRSGPEGVFEERPQHAARLRAFEIDRREVTAGAYGACVAEGRCAAPGCEAPGAAEPVRCVSWQDAMAYCAFVRARLPTEAEWERAAAGTVDAPRAFPWGSTVEGTTEDVTPEGVRDLGGGVAEWTLDPGGFYPSLPRPEPLDAGAMVNFAMDAAVDTTDAMDVAREPVERTEAGVVILDDPRGPSRSPWRVARGGDSTLPVARRTSTLRRFRLPPDRLPWVGFRCAASLP
ncbi:MAG: SUMF1/EgtB/PvdO family nonheme iron enzyme [Deltaproteobacteria bacterium]|nr:SUMF1/EgtB/PvdO family nonheme iron enzyme [Deltaproteobacteria bacterium]